VSLLATAQHKRGDLVEIHGDRGSVRLDADKVLWWGRAGEEELRREGPLQASSKDAFAQLARNFHAAIRDGAEPDPSLQEGLRVQALLDAVYRAHVERRWVAPERV
jgi:predicted dehydrogenase